MEETKVQTEDVDNILNSVSDEYLAKKKRTRIISYSIILALVIALSVVIIVMSSVKVDLLPSFVGEATSYRVVGSTSMSIDKTNEEFDEFNDLFLNSFKSNYLTALFTGRLGEYTINETRDEYYRNNVLNSSKIREYVGNNYVIVRFDEEKQILNANGGVYKSKHYSDTTLTFDEMCVTLNTEDKEGDIVFCFNTTGYLTDRITTITVKANTFNLYKFANE